MSNFGWNYKGTKNRVQINDRVRVSASFGSKTGKVVSLSGFISVLLDGDDQPIDLDARSITFLSREK